MIGATAAAAVVAVAAIVAVVVATGDGDGSTATVHRTTAPPAATTATPTTAPPDAATQPSTTTSEPPTTEPPTTSTTTTTEPPTTTTELATTPPAPVADLGFGVQLGVPDGWRVGNAPDEPLTIGDGVHQVQVTVQQRTAGEGPAPVLQPVVDPIDGGYVAVSWSPVALVETVGGTRPADHYQLRYSALADDGTRRSGHLDAYLRGDGLVAVVDVWGAGDSVPADDEIPPDVLGTLTSSLTAAPPIGPTSTLAVVAPFRVATVHPFVGLTGLTGFTLPPGFDPLDASSRTAQVVGVTNGQIDLLAFALPSPGTVEAAFDAVRAALDEQDPGLVYEQPAAQGARDGWQRLGAGFSGMRDGRPVAGGIDAWTGDRGTAYGFAYLYYADISVDGGNPDPNATQFAYSAFADSL